MWLNIQWNDNPEADLVNDNSKHLQSQMFRPGTQEVGLQMVHYICC